MTKISRQCEACSTPFEAAVADVRRGWGRFCSRVCRARSQPKRPPRVDNRCPQGIIEARIQHDTNGGCWLWSGRIRQGYGRVRHAGSTQGAHRLAYEAFVGPIPENLCVCHRCDVPACVNPAHLFLGTKKDNTADMVAKGRNRNGWSPEPQQNPLSDKLGGAGQ
jgi:hypothetical protein